MRPTQSVGRHGTSVIPANWSKAPREVMAGTRTGTCTLGHPDAVIPGDFDATTGDYPDAEIQETYWTGTCRIQAAPVFGGKPDDTAGEPVTTVGYLVAVDLDADDPADEIRVNDVLIVTAMDDNGDPTLEGRILTVASVARGTLAWERDLVCLDQMKPPTEGS